MRPTLLWLLAVSWSIPAGAETLVAARQLEAGTARENLDHGYEDWRSTYVEGAWEWAPRQVVYAQGRETERFGRTDREGLGGVYVPLSERFLALIEGSVSPTHHVLPRWSLFGQVEAQIARGLSLQLGARHTEYQQAGMNQGVLGGEYYFGNFRFLYTYYWSRLEGADPTGAQRAGLSYYYDDRSHVGLGGSAGDEAESQAPGVVILSTVRSIGFSGRHWLTRHWGLSWEIARTDVVDRYTRITLRAGVRYGF